MFIYTENRAEYFVTLCGFHNLFLLTGAMNQSETSF